MKIAYFAGELSEDCLFCRGIKRILLFKRFDFNAMI